MRSLAVTPPTFSARTLAYSVYCDRLAYLDCLSGEVRRPAHRSAFPDEAPGSDALPLPQTVTQVGVALDSAHLSDSVPLTSHQGHLVPWLMQDAWPLPQKAQVLATLELAAQLWLLSQSHTPVPYALMLAPDGSQQQVYLNEALSAQVQNQVQHVQMLLSKDALPLPLANDFKCQQCPLAGICLPDETHLLRQALKPQPENEAEPNMAHTSVFPPDQEDSEEQGPVKDPAIVRRFLPAREERLALYVQEHGAYISLDGEEFVIKRRNGEFVRARIAHTSHISCFGNVQYSTQMQRKTFDLGLPIFFFSQNGYYQGRTHTYESRQAPLRLAQYRLWNDEAASLEVAKAFVKGKVQNGRTLLRRNSKKTSARPYKS